MSAKFKNILCELDGKSEGELTCSPHTCDEVGRGEWSEVLASLNRTNGEEPHGNSCSLRRVPQ